MQKYAVEIAYLGTNYSGWQLQPNANTVQAELNKALSTFLRTPTTTLGAGRTDAGVHARCLLVQFDAEPFDIHRFRIAINGLLPADIAVNHLFKVPSGFNARFAAKYRSYEYHLVTQKDPIKNGLALQLWRNMDFSKLHAAAKVFLEYDSFESLCKAGADNKTFYCNIMRSEWEENGEHWIYHVKANRFLRGMVRTMVGSMMDVAKGRTTPDDLRRILEAKDRRKAGISAPANGLFLTDVGYVEGLLQKIY